MLHHDITMECASSGDKLSGIRTNGSDLRGREETRIKEKRDWTKTNETRQVHQEEHPNKVCGTYVTKMFKETQTHLLPSNQETRIDNTLLFPSMLVAGSEIVEQRTTPHIVASAAGFNPSLVIVKFCINREVFATAFKVTSTIGEIKESLADVLDLEKDLFTIERDNIEIENTLTLHEFGIQPYSKIILQLTSTRGEMGKAIIAARVRENIPSLDVITVHLGEGGDYSDIVVEIENQCCQKEWLGGFRNKLTNVEYHHAASQTPPRERKVFMYTETGEAIPLLYHRDTQTPFKPKQVATDTVVNKATQMSRTNLYITSTTDKIMTARNYKTSEECSEENDIIKAVITIQRAFRSWIQGKKIRNIIYLQKTLIEDIKKQKMQILREQAKREQQIVTSAAHPVKRGDFYMLYLMVSNWWKREWKRICDFRSAEPKKAESVSLLKKEVQLLEAIERQRILGKGEALKKERMRFLEQTSRPITFKNSKGQMTSIDDIQTQRAREFKEIYSAITRKDILPKDRIDVLFSLKQLFVSHYMDYEYACDLVALIEQEIDLLSIRMKMDDLKGLHKRIEQLYFNFLQQKQFNPKAAKYKKPNLPTTLNELFQCKRCLKLWPASKFSVHVRLRTYAVCRSCEWLQNIGHQRIDVSPYLKMLKQIQNSEMEKCCYTAVCFILQPIGMSYLTNVIWHGHSAISECRDQPKLQHIRWLRDVEWAPWNTILLTDQEAKCHISIPDVFEFYDKTFVEKVRQKHILARNLFITLLTMDHDIRTSGVWSNITDSGAFLHRSHAEIFAVDHEYDTI